MKVSFIGAAGTVTGSRTQIENNSGLYWIDCGLFQGPKSIREKNWMPLQNINRLKAVVLTHSHIDHCGMVPLLVKQGFQGPIYCSKATAELCKILLPDSGYLQEEDAKFANYKKHSCHNPALPLYTQQDAIRSLSYIAPQDPGIWIPLGQDLRFRLSRSGHILGSSFIEVGYDQFCLSRTLTFSGDLGHPDSYLLKEPGAIAESDELVLESTYGDRVHEKGDRMLRLGEVISKVLGRGGTLIIPAFAVGRSQELLYMIRKLEERGDIDTYPVYLDSPMALDTTDLYIKYEDELRPEVLNGALVSPIKTARFQAVRSADESMLLCMNDSPKIVISAAGMLTGGRVLHHLKMRLPDSKSGVLFVGYQVPGSKGYLVKNGLSKIRLHHQEVDIEAEIFSMDSLSAHADSDQIMEWLKRFRKLPNKIFLNHGENLAREALAYRIRTELGIDCVLPYSGDEYTL